jgi:hypothetical protein
MGAFGSGIARELRGVGDGIRGDEGGGRVLFHKTVRLRPQFTFT